MSIISEALRKASRDRSVQKAMPKLESLQGKQQRNAFFIRNKKNIARFIYIVFIICVSGFVIWSLINGHRKYEKISTGYPLASTTEARQDENSFLLPLKGSKQQTSQQKAAFIPAPQEFVLTGVVHGEGAPMAIINGGVYFKGDTVKTAKIVEICEETVILLEDTGKKTELKVK